MSAELPQASPVPSPRPPAPRVTVRHEELKPQQQRIALLTILGPTLGVVLAIALGLWRGFRWLDLGMLLSGIVIGQLFLEVGFHRLFAHRAFDTPHVAFPRGSSFFVYFLLLVFGVRHTSGTVEV